MGDATAAVAKRFPNTKFAIIDFPWVALKGKPKNVRGLVFKEAEAGYLAGVAAATVAKGDPVSSVGGQDVPAVVAFLAGYKAGAKKTNAQDEGALGLLAGLRRPGQVQGARAQPDRARARRSSSQAAGGCGLGALQAAKEQRCLGRSASTPTRRTSAPTS